MQVQERRPAMVAAIHPFRLRLTLKVHVQGRRGEGEEGVWCASHCAVGL